MPQDAQHLLSDPKLLVACVIMQCEHQHDFVEGTRGERKLSTARHLNNHEVWNIALNDTPKSCFHRFEIWIRSDNVGLRYAGCEGMCYRNGASTNAENAALCLWFNRCKERLLPACLAHHK